MSYSNFLISENDNFKAKDDNTDKSPEKQPVNLYIHTSADICILVDPSTNEMVSKQSSVALGKSNF